MVDETPIVDKIPAVDGSQKVYGSQLKTSESTQEAFKTQLNVGTQALGVMNDKSFSHVTITEKKVDNLRVSKRKRIPLEKLRNLENIPIDLAGTAQDMKTKPI